MKNDGGPAFPQNDATVNRINNHDGMSLRDYFAAKAMQAMMSNSNTNTGEVTIEGAAKLIAGFSYVCADAMLAAREAQ